MADWVTLQNKLGLKLRPIDAWPGKPNYNRQLSPFSATIATTLDKLRRELSNLNARKIVLQVAIREQDFRLDGLPRANAIASHPGVILAFDSKHGPLRLSFDGFTKWEFNLRAIAEHLEHLRMASHYGVGRDGEQYKGWAALPAPDTTVRDASAKLVELAGLEPGRYETSHQSVVEELRKKALFRVHPDHGGSRELMEDLERVVKILTVGDTN